MTGVNDVAAIGGRPSAPSPRTARPPPTASSPSTMSMSTPSPARARRSFRPRRRRRWKYGTFSLVDANAGLWTYQLDNSNPAVQALKTGNTLIETAPVKAFDNTAANVVITINGFTDGNEPVNTAPKAGGPVTASATEDSGVASVDLLAGASDPTATRCRSSTDRARRRRDPVRHHAAGRHRQRCLPEPGSGRARARSPSPTL